MIELSCDNMKSIAFQFIDTTKEAYDLPFLFRVEHIEFKIVASGVKKKNCSKSISELIQDDTIVFECNMQFLLNKPINVQFKNFQASTELEEKSFDKISSKFKDEIECFKHITTKAFLKNSLKYVLTTNGYNDVPLSIATFAEMKTRGIFSYIEDRDVNQGMAYDWLITKIKENCATQEFNITFKDIIHNLSDLKYAIIGGILHSIKNNFLLNSYFSIDILTNIDDRVLMGKIVFETTVMNYNIIAHITSEVVSNELETIYGNRVLLPQYDYCSELKDTSVAMNQLESYLTGINKTINEYLVDIISFLRKLTCNDLKLIINYPNQKQGGIKSYEDIFQTNR